MTYLGNTPTTQSFISGTDYFNGTGSQTAFTLSRTVASINDIQVTVNNGVQQPNDAYTISGTTLTMTSAPSAGTNNVYVRYLSTTTQAITPSQGTVSWSTLDSNVQGDLGISFKNRIINGAMQIDQRNNGAVYSGLNGGVYVLDRWNALSTQSSKYTVQQDAGAVTPPVGFRDYLGATSTSAYSLAAGDVFAIRQFIEGFNTADLSWGTASAKTVTLSFWVRSSLTGTFGGNLQNNAQTQSYPFSYTISAANTWEQKSITITGSTTAVWEVTNQIGMQVAFSIGSGSTYSGTAGAWVASNIWSVTGATSVVGTNGATFYLTGVQLEVGTQATIFTTAGGSYGAELDLARRYYQIVQGGAGKFQSLSVIQLYPVFGTAMRTTPTASLKGTVRIDNYAGGDPTVSNIGSQAGSGYTGINYVLLNLTGGSGSPSNGSIGNIYASGSINDGIAFSAEL